MTQGQQFANETVRVYAFEDLVAYHLWFALEKSGTARFKVVVMKGLPCLHEESAYFLPRGFDDIQIQERGAFGTDHIWIAFRDTVWDEGREPLKTALEESYQVQNVLTKESGDERAFLVE